MEVRQGHPDPPDLSAGGPLRTSLVILAGAFILLAGIGYSIYINDRQDSIQRLSSGSQDHTDNLLITYGSSENTVYLPSLMADPDLEQLASEDDIIKVTIELHNGVRFDLYHPSRSVFDSSGGLSRSSSNHITVDHGDGRRSAAILEVTVREG
ncbi:MAG: hypothetical protein QCI82_11595 [Candidatus Thermoplasmatota archaeon]|nr:hypothetical protein [Candidatus Thermoplasmatota archaeon]